ncbi:hypothetical protein EUGRSUZ_B02386 [Eucalyptus grandis]|uniref:Uncharacterized protein n=2 Tax=Eucalyptus grandis TaxID=71139 RepID=A0ACC3LUI0_EUCGR|nr:hypothetical protein EUGRSUZ_B02386 [Eucalyptus grandis]
MALALATYLWPVDHSSVRSCFIKSNSKHELPMNDYTLLTRSMEMRNVHEPVEDGMRTGFYWLRLHFVTCRE